jgi:hypothetical protein
MWVNVVSPIRGEECPVAFTATPLIDKVKAPPFMYPHTLASRALGDSFVMFSAIRHIGIILVGHSNIVNKGGV